jgi:hypothetical protein
MSFREKSAIAMTIILLVGACYYFEAIISESFAAGSTVPPDMHFMIGYVIMIVIASAIIMSALAWRSSREADAPADEREQRIIDKAGNWSGYVLAAGMVGGIMHYAVNMDGNLLCHIAFASLMASQIADYAFQILLFRRGL